MQLRHSQGRRRNDAWGEPKPRGAESRGQCHHGISERRARPGVRCKFEKVTIDKRVILGLRGGSRTQQALLVARHRQGPWRRHQQPRVLQPEHCLLSIPERGADRLQISENARTILRRGCFAIHCAVQGTPNHADRPACGLVQLSDTATAVRA